jgi:ArsR family transcriptional regulator, lead/cadmium/zinc/bismuth-responsive transcriptional repressor
MNNRSYIGEFMSENNSVLDEFIAAQVAEFFSAFSDTSRVRIISALKDCEKNVGAIAAAVNMSESAVSHQLRGLRQMRLVRARKEGRQVFYCLDDDHITEIFQTGIDHVIHG